MIFPDFGARTHHVIAIVRQCRKKTDVSVGGRGRLVIAQANAAGAVHKKSPPRVHFLKKKKHLNQYNVYV